MNSRLESFYVISWEAPGLKKKKHSTLLFRIENHTIETGAIFFPFFNGANLCGLCNKQQKSDINFRHSREAQCTWQLKIVCCC